MSLILEALKKSEQQRRLGEMPTLGTPAPMSRRRRSVRPVLTGLIVVALGAGWWFMRTPHTPPTDEAKPAAAAPAVDPTAATTPAAPPRAARAETKPPAARTVAPPAATAPVVVPMPTTDRPGAVTPPPNAALVGTPAAPAKPVTPPASTATASAPAGKSTAPKASADAKPTPAAKPGGDKASAAQANPAARDAKTATPDTKAPAPADTKSVADAKADAKPVPPKPAAPALPSVWELPYGTRKELPDLKLTMHVYSSVPAERFIVIEGARHVEGDDLGNGVVLHEISPDGMVLDFKGQRFLYPRDGR
ncbi:general secretion pathway protein B [Dokdonella fugitiva]|uniref:General secretion pathway protein B n=1 Tax=Dokdonella fugitiva TaxID=328517 RepID=A0A839EVL2_9GAMM|nr:general secretion pathway protein GspB [Dokdonella fugitiva]MBA8887785.1 general secretion pathway protein B [Dokdonella fugitiva]